MADSVDIDLYDNIEDEFNQDAEFGGGGDLYDDVITAGSSGSMSGRPPSADSSSKAPHSQHSSSSLTSSNYTGKKYMLYIGNLTWWTTDQDLTDAISACGVSDLLEIKFNENRANGQSKGFALVVVGSEASSRHIFERLSRKELHGQVPQVTHYTKQALSQFEAQARKGGELPQNGNFRERDRELDSFNFSKLRGNSKNQPPPPQPGRPGFPPRLQQPPPPRPGLPAGGPPPPGPPVSFAPPPGSLPPVSGPPPGALPPGVPRPAVPPGVPRMDLGPSRVPPPGARGPPPMDNRGPPPRHEWDQRMPMTFTGNGQPPPPGAPFPTSGPPPTQPIPPPGVRPPVPGVRPFIPGGPPPHLPPVSASPLQGPPPPAPHVNPAFFAPPPTHAQAPLPVMTHPPPADPYARPPPVSHPSDQYGRPILDSSSQRRHEPPPPAISDQEFEEIFQRNKTVSSSAINRAVMDASSGDFASAIETLVTAISLIKQSKIASDDRCKILISSLQDTLHGIEEKSYGSSRGSSGGRRSRSRDRDRERERGEKRSRSHRSRSRDREYRERSRDRERHYDERHRERERGERERSDREREREYASSSSGRSRH
ncbi:cleavage and polyadenylation specificity factor subunit 6-like isoform X2 [Pomacea canaliculata]|uniref:cleavage and polyadenylation specificity factor subunit 6-like isoform X2 n=1 Tax=Pomacea canaliculata TaxID=400727 RepID=UPI000D725E67|nr:cleavage and polyadenylation specificity factor subunit 6-like isoform X2 [Pomacea canaliculata]